MSNDDTRWKTPLFTEHEIRVLCPRTPILEPGDQITTGVVVREFQELGPNPKLFGADVDGTVFQLVPVRITNEDGTIQTDVWRAVIEFEDADLMP